MRAAGNLAGVEFIHPPRYHNFTEEWKEIITESGYFFTKDAMKWFGSKVAWDSLTELGPKAYGFITSEQDSGGAWEGQRRYTVRKFDMDSGTLPVSDFGEFDTLREAKAFLAEVGAKNEN